MTRRSADEPHVQTDSVPRWLNYSGLSRVLGLTKWSVYKGLIEVQSRLLHLQPGKWHSGDVFGPFSVRVTAQLPDVVGTDAKTIRRALNGLQGDGIIIYKPGRPRSGSLNEFSQITICQVPIVTVAWYALPRLPSYLGGIGDLRPLPDCHYIWVAPDVQGLHYDREGLQKMIDRAGDECAQGTDWRQLEAILQSVRDQPS